MSFFLRKSFRFGPVGLNLSKSGITPSIGVKGLRVGARAGGRPYIHAGRGGLYYRKSLGGSSRSAVSRPTPERRTLRHDTGVAYAALPGPGEAVAGRQVAVALPSRTPIGAVLAGLVTALAGLLSVVATGGARWLWIGTAALAAAATVRLAAGAWRRRRASASLNTALSGVSAATQLTAAARAGIEGALADPDLATEDREAIALDAYHRLAFDVVADGLVTADELATMEAVERVLGLDPETCRVVRVAAYHAVLLEALADHELTEDEEATLEHVRAEFAIPDDEVGEEANVLDRLRTLGRIRAGELPEVTPSRALQKSEICHYEAPARLLKERNLDSFQRDGVRYNVRGMVVDKEGSLFITQKRIVLMHAGTTAIRFSQVRDIDVDADENLIRLVRDGVATPTIISTPDAVTAGAIMARAAGM